MLNHKHFHKAVIVSAVLLLGSSTASQAALVAKPKPCTTHTGSHQQLNTFTGLPGSSSAADERIRRASC